jgi:hypothetical protein
MVVVMKTGNKHEHPLEVGLEHINPIKALLVMIFGPADGRGNPLVGTRYDPVVRQKIETERRHERWARQEERRHAHAVRRYSPAAGGGTRAVLRGRRAPDVTANNLSTRNGLLVPAVAADEYPT